MKHIVQLLTKRDGQGLTVCLPAPLKCAHSSSIRCMQVIATASWAPSSRLDANNRIMLNKYIPFSKITSSIFPKEGPPMGDHMSSFQEVPRCISVFVVEEL